MKLSLKIPPVVQGIVSILLFWLFDRYAPLHHIKFSCQNAVACALIGIGVIVTLSGVSVFTKLNTTVNPRYPEKAHELAVIGIYQYSRNPMYLGILLVLTGVAVYFGALSNVFVVSSFVIFISRYQIVPEEVVLHEKFGESYTYYAQNVRRWL